MPENEKIKGLVNDSFDYLRKSLNNLNSQQSTGPAPLFYPTVNGQSTTPAPQNQASTSTDKPKT